MNCPSCATVMVMRHNFPDGHSHVCPLCGHYSCGNWPKAPQPELDKTAIYDSNTRQPPLIWREPHRN